MSVGVCIVNRLGISLAADSAGTLLGQNKMVYNSMNKVFSLSRKFPYGAIIYNKSVIYNASVEQIIKEFRTYLDSKIGILNFFDIINEFKEFIKINNEYYKFNICEIPQIKKIIKDLVVTWGNELKKLYDSTNLNPIECKIKEYIDIDENAPKYDEEYNFYDHIFNNYFDFFCTEMKIVFSEIFNYQLYVDNIWKCICKFFNYKLKFEENNYTGILFAGYGTNDAFPKYMDIHIYGVYGGELKYEIVSNYEEAFSSASIYPVAQSDVISTFCEGITNNLYRFIPITASNIIKEKINTLSEEEFSNEQKNKLQVLFSNYEKEMIDQIDFKSRKEEIDPLLLGVQSIQLSDLAFLSESLVNLTSLKRTYALNGMQQTVGGPTDVAVISKSDGFIWIKRKLYFDKELNIDYVNKINN